MSGLRSPSGRVAGLALCAITVAGCGGPKAYVHPQLRERPPARLAVLPFTISYRYDIAPGEVIPESHRVGQETLRKTFYYGLTPLGYDDIKLAAVDERLAASWGPVEAGGWQAAGPQALGEALGADALIYGDIRRLVHLSTPLYTETSLDATLQMVDARTGQLLWRQRLRAAERGGAVMKKGQVVDFLKDQARSFHPSVKFLRVADVMVRRALRDLPDPPLASTGADAAPGMADAAGQALLLAVLPLGADGTKERQGAQALRADLVASLQESPFDTLEIHRVDALLQERGWREGEPLPEALPLDALAQALGADLVLQGAVTDWGRTYFVVQSWVTAGLKLELIDAQSGVVIWSAARKNRRQAGLLKGPTGYKSLVTAPITGMRKGHLERIGTHLARELVRELATSPAVLTYLHERHPGEQVR